jgi:aldehyde dehydrogenase (NAD+)
MEFLKALGIEPINKGTSTGSVFLDTKSDLIESYSPVNGQKIGAVYTTTDADYQAVMVKAQEAFKVWRNIPAPKRGEIVRQCGEEFRKYKQELGQLVSYEMGKSLQEGLGEVQEIIDICDFAVGLSRQLYGLTMHSERPNHQYV